MEHINLKTLMVKNKLNQADMAKLLEINLVTFNLKLNGKRDFTITEIEKIRKFFDLPYESIFFGESIRKMEIRSA